MATEENRPSNSLESDMIAASSNAQDFLPATTTDTPRVKVLRCIDWLQKQNNQEVKRSIRNKNDIQFIIQMNAERKNFLLSAAEDEATVPHGIGELEVEPLPVPVRSLRVKDLRLECDWQSCRHVFFDYEDYQKHVLKHAQDVHVIETDEAVEYVCQWDICGFKIDNFPEMVRHLNYHSYHGKLLAIGFNGRATLKLLPCNKDSTKRNQIPPLKSNHCCMWIGCEMQFNSMQVFLNHVNQHLTYTDKLLCSWAGCGATPTRKSLLVAHLRSHTGEKIIACYHCGGHFANNRKLLDHLRRQNVNPQVSYPCPLCAGVFSTAYLLAEHARRHVSVEVCARCDMTAVSRTALAEHLRYRHLDDELARCHACPHCHYKAITKADLRKHILTHTRKRRQRNDSDCSDSDGDTISSPKVRRKYACHLCPEKEMKVFSRGHKLTIHLIKKHGAQWPFGYSRFRYQISEDGMYRLTTTRYEDLEVSRKIVDGQSGPKEPITTDLEFTLKQTSEATETKPRSFEIVLKDSKQMEKVNIQSNKHYESESDQSTEVEPKYSPKVENKVEIEMCDVDEKGNIIKSEVLKNVIIS